MKTQMIAALAGAAALAGVAAPMTASAQPYGYGPRYDYSGGWRDAPRGPRYEAWRRGYYGRYHRYPVKTCRPSPRGPVCFWR